MSISDIRYTYPHKAEFDAVFGLMVEGARYEAKWSFEVQSASSSQERAVRVMAKRLRKDVQRMAVDPEFLAELQAAYQGQER